MSLADRSCGTFRFGAFELKVREGELRRGKIRVKLQDLPLRLLAALLDRPGAVILRDELHRQLWPEASFLDFDAGLNTAVRKLREALNDDPGHPRFIETIHRRGYRFLAPVEWSPPPAIPAPSNVDSAASAPPIAAAAVALAPVAPAVPVALEAVPAPAPPARQAEPEVVRGVVAIAAESATAQPAATRAANIAPQPPSPRSTRGRRRRWPLWLGAAAAVAASLLWWNMPLPPPALVHVEQVTTSGRLDNPLPPVTDANRIYYLERYGDLWRLMETGLKGGDAEPVSTPFRNTGVLDAAPDDSVLLVGSFDQRGTEMPLWVLPVTGGAPMRLGNLVADGAAYAHNGRQLALVRGHDLWLAAADGSGARLLAQFAGLPRLPSWSSDDRWLSLTLEDPVRLTRTLWVIAADGSSRRNILPGFSHPTEDCCGAWTPDGRYYLFNSIHDGHSSLWALREQAPWWRRAPRGPFQLTVGPVDIRSVAQSRDGQRVYFTGGAWHEDLERWDLATQAFAPFLPALLPAHPAFSRDGRWLAYLDNYGELWRSRSDGGDRLKLAPGKLGIAFPRWSPDATALAYFSQPLGASAMAWLVPRDGGAPQPLAPGRLDVRDPDWSPDGTQLVVAYLADPADPRLPHALALVNATTHAFQPLAGSTGLSAPRWSPDGRTIAAITVDQRQLKLFDVPTGKWRLADTGTAIGIPAWSADGNFLYYQDLLAPGEPLRRLAMRSQSIETVANFNATLAGGVSRCAFYALAPDGAPLLSLNRSSSNIYRADLLLP